MNSLIDKLRAWQPPQHKRPPMAGLEDTIAQDRLWQAVTKIQVDDDEREILAAARDIGAMVENRRGVYLVHLEIHAAGADANVDIAVFRPPAGIRKSGGVYIGEQK